VSRVTNPRQEADENELAVRNDSLIDLGLDPIMLDSGLLSAEAKIAQVHCGRVDRDRILARSYWNRSRRSAVEGRSG